MNCLSQEGLRFDSDGGAEGKKMLCYKNKHFLFQVRQNKIKYEIKGNTVQLSQNCQGKDLNHLPS
jgi:hypothetical protein